MKVKAEQRIGCFMNTSKRIRKKFSGGWYTPPTKRHAARRVTPQSTAFWELSREFETNNGKRRWVGSHVLLSDGNVGYVLMRKFATHTHDITFYDVRELPQMDNASQGVVLSKRRLLGDLMTLQGKAL